MIVSEGLPPKVVRLATKLYARETGFSGPELHDLFADYTDVLGTYSMGGGGPSRWQLFQTGLSAMSVPQQRQFLLELIKGGHQSRSYQPPLVEDVADLRSLLLDGVAPGASSGSERLAELDWDHVQRSWDGALSKVVSDPEGAITATRTLLESVCKHILDERDAGYDDAWDLGKLYKAAATAMQIAPDQHGEQVIKQILSGTVSVVNGLAAMRNALSDAHGRGKHTVRPAPRHARLAVNTGFGIATFLMDIHVEKPARGLA